MGTEVDALPFITDWFEGLPVIYIVFIAATCLLFVGITVMTVIMGMRVHYCVPDEFNQADLYFVVFTPFITSGCCLIGNIIPKASAIMYSLGLIYLMITLNITVVLVTKVFGNRRNLVEWMKKNQKTFEFASKPYCCCCSCLPTVYPTARAMRLISYMVKQSPLLRIAFQIIIMIAGVEQISPDSALIQAVNGAAVASTLLAKYGCHIIVLATKEGLVPYNMLIIFQCVDTAQLLYTVQKFLLDLIAKNGGMGGLSMAPPEMVSQFWHNTSMIVYLTIFCVLLLRNVTPEKSAFFEHKTRQNGKAVPLADL